MIDLYTLLDPSSEGNFAFYPGNVLKGTVELHLTRQLEIKALSVTAYGRARTYWSVDESKRILLEDGTYEDQYNGKEVYIDSRKYLLGQQHGPLFKIAAGVHKYNFAFKLPEHLPYSFSIPNGDLSYFVVTILETEHRPDKEDSARFNIVRNDDLRLIPKLQEPYELEYMWNFCCLFCKSQPIFMTVSVPRTGFIGGEKIPIKIDYVNRSRRDVRKTLIKLRQRYMLYFNTPKVKSKEVIETIAKFEVAGVERNSSKFIEEHLEIPYNLKNSNVEYSRYIGISYFLMILIDAKEPNCITFKLFAPITIGSTPINTNVQQLVPSEPVPSTSAPSAPEQLSINHDLPPSFAEAMRMKELENPALMQPTFSSIGWNYPK